MSRIDTLSGRIDSLHELIGTLESKPLNAKRSRRIERLYDRIDILEDKVSAIEAPPTYEPVDLDNGVFDGDAFDITFAKPDDNYDFNRIEIEITDSETDDSFTAGDPLWIEITGTETRPNGRERTVTKRSALANGDYWEEGNQMTVLYADKFVERFAGFDEINVTIASDKPDGWRGFDEDDIVATQTFAANDAVF
jgi:hypothetical protein